MNCAFCPHHKCYTEGQNCTKYSHEEVFGFYSEDDRRMMRASSATESRNYMKMTRLEERCVFCQRTGREENRHCLCIGLPTKRIFCAQYFKNQGFCGGNRFCCQRSGSVDKDILELEKIKPGKHEAMCNPRTQAQLLNNAGTELNFIVGLCVGHDMQFTMASKAPVSCLITKDRVLANNPAGAVYSRYWRRKLGILEEGTV